LADAAIAAGPAADLREVIVDLCHQAGVMVERQHEVLGTPDAEVTVVGGGSRSPAWNRIKADVLGMPIRLPRIREATALGAALLAGVGAGVYGSALEAAAVATAQGSDRVEPSTRRVTA
jgi:autoinducer 2 (AI-2) kinase